MSDFQPVQPLPITADNPAEVSLPRVAQTAAPDVVVLGGNIARQSKQMEALDKLISRVRKFYLLALGVAIAVLVGASVALQMVLN